jgi:hypothetical protein
VHYRFMVFSAAPWDVDTDRSRDGQRNGLCGAAQSGSLDLVTGLHTGRVPLRIELLEQAPELTEGWEDVVEVPLLVDGEESRAFCLMSFDHEVSAGDLAPGPYRARWHALGMDAANDQDTRLPEDPTLDRYLLQLWPAALAPDAVLRQGSEIAAYWHGVARQTAVAEPLPPGD